VDGKQIEQKRAEGMSLQDAGNIPVPRTVPAAPGSMRKDNQAARARRNMQIAMQRRTLDRDANALLDRCRRIGARIRRHKTIRLLGGQE
jgi:hypothetical protein